MANEHLRAMLGERGLRESDLAAELGVDPKTVIRWINEDGRVPHPPSRSAICRLLRVDETTLWPSLATGQRATAVSQAELVTVYPTRGQVPSTLWTSIVRNATETISLLVYAGLFWFDTHSELTSLLVDKADSGVHVRLAFGDPDSAAIARRGQEEKIPMAERIRLTLGLIAPLVGHPGIDIRVHDTTLYNSMYRGDDTLLVNMHTYGSAALQSPVMHLRQIPGGRLFAHYTGSFDRVWATARPYEPAAEQPPARKKAADGTR